MPKIVTSAGNDPLIIWEFESFRNSIFSRCFGNGLTMQRAPIFFNLSFFTQRVVVKRKSMI